MKNLAILVPSRERPHNIVDLIKSLDETETESDLIVILDDDEPCFEQYIQLGATILTVEKDGRGMAKPLNFAANLFKNDYHHFAFLGDDHRPRTKNWDVDFINALDELETGLVYGNDLFQGEQLPTAVAMTGNIVKALEGMVPPGMIHLYLDNFWLQLGKDLGAIRYMDHIIIEHLHPAAGKGEWDEGYKTVNAQDIYSADQKAFVEYIESPAYVQLLKSLEQV